MVRDSMLQRARDAQGREVRRRESRRMESGHHPVRAAGGRAAVRRRRRDGHQDEDPERGAQIPGHFPATGKGAVSGAALETTNSKTHAGGSAAESVVVGICAPPAGNAEVAAACAILDGAGEGSTAAHAGCWS